MTRYEKDYPLFFVPDQEYGNRQILQRIVLPEHGIPGACDLYGHSEKPKGTKSENSYQKKHVMDGYINLFHKERWQSWTRLRHFGMYVVCHGQGRLSLYGCTSGAEGILRVELAQYTIAQACPPALLFVSLNADFPYFYLAWEDANEEGLCVTEAAFTAEVNKEHRVHIAIVSATFRRIADISRLVSTYRTACEKSTDFARSSHLVVVNNEPGDVETFSAFSADSRLTILHNPVNRGGAGAFTTGARWSVEQGGFSHVLFMDDDALVHEETWFRTLALLRNLSEHCRDQIVSGAMFTLEDPAWCHTMQEALNPSGLVVNCAGRCAADSLDTVLTLLGRIRSNFYADSTETNPPALRPYAAWWYCVIPTQAFRRIGYPLPVFFRGDDQEFGMRLAREVLPLNGICVWHPAFENKKGTLRTYLGFRNYAITNVLHFPRWRSNIIRLGFLGIGRALAANDYEEAAARILAFHDFLRFSHVPQNGEQLGHHVMSYCASFRCVLSAPQPRTFTPIPDNKRLLLPLALVWLTLGGSLIPRFLRRDAVQIHTRQLSGFPASWSRLLPEKTANPFSAARAAILSLTYLGLVIRMLITPRKRVLRIARHFEHSEG